MPRNAEQDTTFLKYAASLRSEIRKDASRVPPTAQRLGGWICPPEARGGLATTASKEWSDVVSAVNEIDSRRDALYAYVAVLGAEWLDKMLVTGGSYERSIFTESGALTSDMREATLKGGSFRGRLSSFETQLFTKACRNLESQVSEWSNVPAFRACGNYLMNF